MTCQPDHQWCLASPADGDIAHHYQGYGKFLDFQQACLVQPAAYSAQQIEQERQWQQNHPDQMGLIPETIRIHLFIGLAGYKAQLAKSKLPYCVHHRDG